MHVPALSTGLNAARSSAARFRSCRAFTAVPSQRHPASSREVQGGIPGSLQQADVPTLRKHQPSLAAPAVGSLHHRAGIGMPRPALIPMHRPVSSFPFPFSASENGFLNRTMKSRLLVR